MRVRSASSLRAHEVVLLEKLETKHGGQQNKVQSKGRMTFELAAAQNLQAQAEQQPCRSHCFRPNRSYKRDI